MKSEDRQIEEAGARLCIRKWGRSAKRGDARGRPSWRSSFLGDLGAKFLAGLVEKDRRSRGGGKSGNPAAVAGFPSAVEKSCLWTFPRSGFFHGPSYPTDCAVNTDKEKAMTKKHSQPMPVLAIPKLSEGQLEPLFRRLNLAHTRRIYQNVADRAEKENWSYRDFLALLLAEEVAHRKQTRLQRCTRQAHFPFLKTIDEFDFSLQTTLRQSLLGSYLGPDFVTEGRSLILYGKTGRGKTHLAVAIGYRAIQNGFETLCTTAAELVEDLSNASKQGRLQQALLTYTRAHVLRGRSRLLNLRPRCRQCVVSCGQRSPLEKTTHDHHHQQAAQRVGKSVAR